MEGQHRLSLAEDPVTLCKFSPVVRNISKAIFNIDHLKSLVSLQKLLRKNIMESAP